MFVADDVALMLGASALAGGGAGLASYFGGKPKKPSQLTFDPSTITKPSQTETGIPISELVRSRLGGNVGFGKEFVDQYTNPYIASYNDKFNTKTMPGLKADMSSMGLGRSTNAGNVYGTARRQQGLDINQMVADAYLKNLVQGRADTSEALQYGNSLATGDYQAELAKATGQMDAQKYNIGNEMGYNSAVNQNNLASIGTGFSTAGSIWGMGQQDQMLKYLTDEQRRRTQSGVGASASRETYNPGQTAFTADLMNYYNQNR